ncbi:MAG: tetratricopeptide repeat protein [Nitrospirae bacterium]|nr:MAG: tetratricopeptide repeat protein [Nitrospirota bacterium]
MLLLIALAVLLGTVIVILTSPFWRKDPDPIPLDEHDAVSQEIADLSVEREVLVQSLQELDVELAQGRLERDDYERLKATDEHRLLQVLDRLDALAAQQEDKPPVSQTTPASPRRVWIPLLACTVLVMAASLGIYTFVHWQALQRMAANSSPVSGAPNPLEMVARLEERLRNNPDDLEGQIMAGRSYMALERYEDARRAWEKVLELDPTNHEAHYHLGVILMETRKIDDPAIFQQALQHFDTIIVDLPNQPGINWYRGVALWYLKRYREADEAWTTAFKNLEPGSRDAQFVKDALTKLRAGQQPF